MAKITGPLFSMRASGSFGDIVFDRRGFARLKGSSQDRQTPNQGNFRQTMVVAQKCAKVCGPATRQLLKEEADDPAQWSAYLVKNLIGPNRDFYLAALTHYMDRTVDQTGWEAEAASLGLREINVVYAAETSVSPGAQLFALASTLYAMGLYASVGQPNGNAAAWKAEIVS